LGGENARQNNPSAASCNTYLALPCFSSLSPYRSQNIYITTQILFDSIRYKDIYILGGENARQNNPSAASCNTYLALASLTPSLHICQYQYTSMYELNSIRLDTEKFIYWGARMRGRASRLATSLSLSPSSTPSFHMSELYISHYIN